jgi:hypothetical protein
MKQCPNCRTTYTDDSLLYCLADGTRLGGTMEEQPTLARTDAAAADETIAFGDRDKMRIDIAAEKNSSPVANAITSGSKQSSSGAVKIAAVAGALLLLAVVGVGAVGLLVYFTSRQSGNAAVKNTSPSPAPTTQRGPSETDQLRDQIANLQRQLDQQKGTKGGSSVAPVPLPTISGSTTSARADSPRDGFLALRSLPSTEFGDRIAKIPHGASVAIGGCGPVTKSGSRSGRWCQARYNGMSGWVFDAYLTY